ncbi:hypothetical protein Val02_92110 [Virgisporangium aliadipatigenens]|uniref:Uncharacterized protein n=1 Tax=Virgisporangium aliadipatigenens TaxID=741659 RepID=A0A8J3YZ39_9ACTN|nr:hypothetical protein [Virgisporangium aliadipatigenens]GIJ52325.1 hypothetical protein Val02_92110 [Virgisporangium aliadipatigenens]
MAGHDLIDAYLAAAARCLPREVVDELADGLVETYQRQRSEGLDADAAAETAIERFGDLDVVLAAFVRQSPGRSVARILLCSGPVVGTCWGAALLAGPTSLPAPALVRVVFGAAVLTVVGLLAVAATARLGYRRTRAGAVGGTTLIVLDAVAIVAVLNAGPGLPWPTAAACAASLTRIVWTAHALRRVVSH